MNQFKAAEWINARGKILLSAGVSALAALLFLSSPSRVQAVGAQP
ncbi:MAG: hypothetical protein JWM54_2146, partial [Acidobacteriaceae bacterium]|nr:hypothetical protein [Acidobacteriaceae bacterium]